ncbi:MAG: ATP-binding protein [Planctomycetes bacterium]|nr:ATP-binding protein [Planctomycetota bacterium]
MDALNTLAVPIFSTIAAQELAARVLASRSPGVARGATAVVDEIQRLPSLLNEVHRHIETRGLRFILCGSSARQLKQAGTNLLAGRAVRRSMYPFVPEELGDAFSLEDALAWGTLPVVHGAEDRRGALEAYAQMYLKEEIRAEALVRNLPGFARFLPVAALFHGQRLSVSSLARDAGVSRTTVEGYLDVLEDTLLAYRLPAYEGQLRVRERRHPKLYFVDPGLPRALKRQLDPPTAEERGPLFEGWVAGLLRAYRDYRGLFDDWYTWSPAEALDTEVDFLIRRGRAWAAVEAKATRAPADRAFKGLRAVAGLRGLTRRILVHLGDRPFRTVDGIEGLPVADFVRLVERDALFGGR